MTMLLIIIVLVLVISSLSYIYKQARKKLKEEKAKVEEYAQAVEKRDHAIHALEEVYREEGEQKKKIRTGSDTDEFSASLDILSDLSKTGTEAGSDKDKS